MSGKWSVVPGYRVFTNAAQARPTNFGTYPEASDFRERVFRRPAAQTEFAQMAGHDARLGCVSRSDPVTGRAAPLDED
jgi:hypothetical protein